MISRNKVGGWERSRVLRWAVVAFALRGVAMGTPPNVPDRRLWQEAAPGVVVIMATSTRSPLQPERWERVPGPEGEDGPGAVIWRGPGTWQDAVHGARPYVPFADRAFVLRYAFRVEQPGRYHVKVRNSHQHHDGDNDVWISVNESSYQKHYDWQENQWTFDETGVWATHELAAGEHRLELGGRSYGFAIERIVIYRDGAVDVAAWTDPACEESFRDE